jgi:hypothetical protein
VSLSPSLARWREDLAKFPDEVAIGIAPLLPRLAALVGPLGQSYSEGSEPNGYDGVTQRGEYQRLVTSDWLLALAEPDEFLRRAAMHEHSFLKFALHEPRGSKRSVVLFDAGPSQLGTPRLVHIALLLVLGRRALTARAEFHWTTLQTPQVLRQGTEADDVRYLLASRSPFEANATRIAALEKTFGAFSKDDDVWLVGGAGCIGSAAGRGHSTICVTDPMRPENDVVEVRVKTRSRDRTLALPLPEPKLRTQLIRNPFEAPKRFEVPAPPSGAFWFSPDGKRLMFREGKGVRTRMQLSAAGGWGTPRLPGHDERMIAATWYKKDLCIVTLRAGRLYLTDGFKSWSLRTTQRSFEPPYGEAAFCPLYVFGKKRHVLICDGAGVVFAGTLGTASEGDSVPLRPILSETLRLAWRRGHLDYAVKARGDHVEFGRITLELQLFPAGKSLVPVRGERILSGFDNVGQLGAFAIERNEPNSGSASWEVTIGLRSTEVISVLDTDRVVGLFRGRGATPHQQRWSLLCFSSLDGRIHAVHQAGRAPLPAFDEGITELVQADVSSRIAYKTSDGRVKVLEAPETAMKPIAVHAEER